MGRMMAWLGVALGAVYLIYVGGGWWGIYSPYLRIPTMTIAAVTLATWAFVAWRNPAWRPRSVMFPAIVACLTSLSVSTLFSRYPRVSVEYLGYAIVLATLYLLLVRLFAADYFRRRLVSLASMLFVTTAGAYIVLVLAEWIHWWSLVGEVGIPPLRPGFGGLTYNNPSAALTMATLLAVPPAAAFGGKTIRGLAVLGVILAAIGAVALMSGSRSGWFALGLTAIIASCVWLTSSENRSAFVADVRRVLRRPIGRAIAAFIVVGGVGLLAIVTPIVVRRALEGGEDLRLGYALVAIRIFLDSLLVGTGPGTWVIQRPGVTNPSETDYYIPHAHNVEVQTLAELGVVGAVAGILLLLNLAWLLRQAASSGDGRRRWWAWAAGLGLLYFALHQVFDFYVNMPAFLFAAAIPVAYLDATMPSTSRVPAPFGSLPTRPSRIPSVVALMVVALAVGGLLWQEIPALRQADAVEAANDRDWAAADLPAREAAALDPGIGSYELTAGLTSARSGDHAASAEYFERVARRDDLPEAWLNLAAEQAELGDDASALESIRAALRVGFQRPVVAMPAGDLALRLGNEGLAVSAFSHALAEMPSLAADPWWRSDPARQSLFAAIVAAAIDVDSEGGWEIALMAGDPERAAAIAAARELGPLPDQVIGAWSGNTTAAESLLATCNENPRDLGLVLWCARLESHRGNFSAANDFREMANIINLGAYYAGAEMRVSSTGMVGRQLVGDPADLWGTYTYRRPAPWDILVPSLIHLKVE